MSAHLYDEAVLLDQQRTMAMTLGAVRLDGLDVLVVVRAEHLMQVRMRRPCQATPKTFPEGNVFPDHDSV